MKKTHRFTRMAALVMALALCLALVACGDGGNEGEGTGGKTVVYATPQSSLLVSPYAASSLTQFMLNEALNGYLALPSAPGQTVEEFDLDLAKSLTVVDDVTVDFELYDNITDSAGNPIKASDVVFSFNTCAETGNYPNLTSAVANVEATGDLTGRITFTDGQIGRKEYAIANCAIVSEAWYSAASDETINTMPVGAGTYYVSDYMTGSSVTLTKVENYWQTDESLIPALKKPGVDSYKLVVNEEESQRVIAMENHEVDVTSIDPIDMGRFMNDDGTPKDGYSIAQASAIGGYFLFMNMDPQNTSVLAANPKLREAICYGINREDMLLAAGLDEVSGGLANSYAVPALGGYLDDPNYYTYDPDYAQQCMAESGLSDVTLKVLYSTNNANTQALVIMQENLAALGITLELVPVDQALMSTQKNDSTAWDILMDYKGASNGYAPFMFTSAFNSANYENGAVNFSHDTHLEELAINAAMNYSQETCDEFSNYLRDQFEIIGLYYQYTYYVSQDGITQLGLDNIYYPVIQASTFADDYASQAIA